MRRCGVLRVSESDWRFVNFVIFSNGTVFALFALSGPSDKGPGCKREWSKR